MNVALLPRLDQRQLASPLSSVTDHAAPWPLCRFYDPSTRLPKGYSLVSTRPFPRSCGAPSFSRWRQWTNHGRFFLALTWKKGEVDIQLYQFCYSASEQSTQSIDRRDCALPNSELETTDTFYALNAEGLPPHKGTTSDYQGDQHSFSQAPPTCDPRVLQLPSVRPAVNEYAGPLRDPLENRRSLVPESGSVEPEAANELDPPGIDCSQISFPLALEQPTGTYDASNTVGFPQYGITATGYQNDYHSLSQNPPACDPLLPQLPLAISAVHEHADVLMSETTPWLGSGSTGAINDFSHEDAHYPIDGEAYGSSFSIDLDGFPLAITEAELPNGSHLAQATEGPPSEEQAIGPQAVSHQPQNPSSMSANATARWGCANCSLRFERLDDAFRHRRSTGHHEFACPVLNCDYSSNWEMSDHIRNAHPELQVCNQCKEAFRTPFFLGKHATETGHASFLCGEEDCGKTFSRFDVFRRHQGTHRLNVRRFPCPHCRKHRGADGFKRRDHLTQHLRNYHNIGVDEVRAQSARERSCLHEGCSEWRPEQTEPGQHAFKKSSDYIDHMRKVHKESDFPCPEPGYERSGPKGYFRMRDL